MRKVITNDGETLPYNVFGKYGWSGLPICDMDTGVPVGIYGDIKTENHSAEASVRVSTAICTGIGIDWKAKVAHFRAGDQKLIYEI